MVTTELFMMVQVKHKLLKSELKCNLGLCFYSSIAGINGRHAASLDSLPAGMGDEAHLP